MMWRQWQIQNQSCTVQKCLFRTGKRRPELTVTLVIHCGFVDRTTIVSNTICNKALWKIKFLLLNQKLKPVSKILTSNAITRHTHRQCEPHATLYDKNYWNCLIYIQIRSTDEFTIGTKLESHITIDEKRLMQIFYLKQFPILCIL